MRLARITWRSHQREITRERYELKAWLEEQGAHVSAWMLTWEVRW